MDNTNVVPFNDASVAQTADLVAHAETALTTARSAVDAAQAATQAAVQAADRALDVTVNTFHGTLVLAPPAEPEGSSWSLFGTINSAAEDIMETAQEYPVLASACLLAGGVTLGILAARAVETTVHTAEDAAAPVGTALDNLVTNVASGVGDAFDWLASWFTTPRPVMPAAGHAVPASQPNGSARSTSKPSAKPGPKNGQAAPVAA